MMQSRWKLACATVAIAVPVLLVPRLDTPFPWLGGIWAGLCLALVRSARTRRARLVWWNVGAAALVLTAAELTAPHLMRLSGRVVTNTPEGTLYVPDPVLGFRPKPGSRTRSVMTTFDRPGYDVVYTIGADGLRIDPPGPAGETAPCILFFGCSFTFGEGVGDDETMPYRVALRAEGRFRVHNFAYSGYGPHQMLAAIESGRVEQAVHCVPRYAVYGLLAQHVDRVAGRFPWDPYGPRYVVQPGGDVARQGNFKQPWPAWVWELCRKSALCRASLTLGRHAHAPHASVEPDSRDVALLLAVLRASRDQLSARYPAIEFDTLVWPTRDRDDAPLIAELERHGLRPHSLAAVIAKVQEQRGTASLPEDFHPNAATQDAVAEDFVREILKLAPSPSASPP